MSYAGINEQREKRFKPEKLIDITTIVGYGIKRLSDGKFMGFNTNKGIVSIWNEERKAKLAFAYHTNNTIDERIDEYIIVPITESRC